MVAGASLGAGAGALIAGPLTDHFGRKTLLIIDAAIYAIGALLSAFTVNAFMLLSSGTLIGLAIGADSGDRYRLPRGVRAPRASRPAEHYPAVDDHRGNPGVISRGRGRPGGSAA